VEDSENTDRVMAIQGHPVIILVPIKSIYAASY